MPAMSKKQKKHLQELSDRCYEIEMSRALDGLYDDFKKWKKDEITVWDLNERIHQYLNNAARNLNKFYEALRNPANAVARGISRGIIKMEDMQKDCHLFVKRHIEYYDNEKKGRTTH
jgi:hypothetical protein